MPSSEILQNNLTDLRESANKLLFPRMLLSVYEGESPYIEYHLVRDGVAGAGKPVSDTFMKKLGATLLQNTGEYFFSGTIPWNLKYYKILGNSITAVWIRDAKETQMYFTENLTIPDGTFMLPQLVFKLVGTRLEVYAIDEWKGDDSVLCKAPFHNVSDSVCMGSAKTIFKDHSFQGLMDGWEGGFFNSKFSHLSGDNPIKGNLGSLYRVMANTKIPFPSYEELKPTKKTLKDLYEK